MSVQEERDKRKREATGEPTVSGGKRTEASPQGRDSYLETIRNTVDRATNVEGVEYFVFACGCKCSFCPECCIPYGLNLTKRIHPVLETFVSMQMWTFTIDPLLFASPQVAFEHVRNRRSISEFIRAVYKAGHLISKRYFYTLEWQKRTEMPHWHLLLEAKRIPFEFACKVWNRNRPKNFPPPSGNRPGFGSVRFSKGDFANPLHAARYATKYVIKYPQHGFPDWVLDSPRRIRRYGTSRGLLAHEKPEKTTNSFNPSPEDIAHLTHDALCLCVLCRSEPKTPRNTTKTIRERVGKCRDKAVIMKHDICLNEAGEFTPTIKCIGAATEPFQDLKDRLNPDRQIDDRRLRIETNEVRTMLKKKLERSNWDVDPCIVKPKMAYEIQNDEHPPIGSDKK